MAGFTARQTELRNIIDGLTRRKMDLMGEISKLSPVVAKLSQIETAEKERKGLLEKLAGFPIDLDKQISALTHQLDQADYAATAVIWLKRIPVNRTALVDSLRRRNELVVALPGLQENERQAFAKISAAEIALSKAHQAVLIASGHVVQAQSQLTSIKERERKFGLVSGEKECSYCGSLMTPAHVEKERSVIQTEKKRIKSELTEAEATLAARRFDELTADSTLKNSRAAHQAAKTEADTRQNDISTANREIEGQVKNLAESYQNLVAQFRAQIAAEQPMDVDAWAVTVYPSPADINHFEKTAGQKAALKALVDGQKRVAQSREITQSLLEKNQTTLAGLRSTLPADAATAPTRMQQAEQESGQIDSQIEVHKANLSHVADNLKLGQTDEQDLRQQKEKAEANIQKENTRQGEMQQALGRLIAKIPKSWQSVRATLTVEVLADLHAEAENLGQYVELNNDLSFARQNIAGLDGQLRRLGIEINKVSVKARRPANDIRIELAAAQRTNNQAHTTRDQASEGLEVLQRTKTERDDLDGRYKGAERKGYLYGILVRKFSDKGIQQELIEVCRDRHRCVCQ